MLDSTVVFVGPLKSTSTLFSVNTEVEKSW